MFSLKCVANRLSDSDCGFPHSQFLCATCSGDRGPHSTDGEQEWHRGGLRLPSVTPVLVVAAAGESLTASVPLPAVYGYTPEQRIGTRK